MSEYWVSKKQYWCKYCSIWVRDDAPSRRLHETGLKHQGQRERFIRDLYKGGERAKREKETEARQYARIEAAAKAAHTKDGGSYSGRVHHSAAASSSRPRPKESKDKWSNYSTAAQMGFDVDESQETAFQIEQSIRGRDTKVGVWETVDAVPRSESVDTEGVPVVGGKRKLEDEEDEVESFKFEQRDKRPVLDPYDDDDWDPSVLGGLKLKKRDTSKDASGAKEEVVKSEVKVEISEEQDATGSRGVKGEISSDVALDLKTVKREDQPAPASSSAAKQAAGANLDVKPKLEPSVEGTIPDRSKDAAPAAFAPEASTVAAAPAPAASLFKKRRPAPSSRKK